MSTFAEQQQYPDSHRAARRRWLIQFLSVFSVRVRELALGALIAHAQARAFIAISVLCRGSLREHPTLAALPDWFAEQRAPERERG